MVVNMFVDLQSNDCENCFTVKPEELLLRTGEEREVVVSFAARSNRKEWYAGVLSFNSVAKCMTACDLEFSVF